MFDSSIVFYMYTDRDLVLDAARLKCASVLCVVALILETKSRQVLRKLLNIIIFYNYLLTINDNNDNKTRSLCRDIHFEHITSY